MTPYYSDDWLTVYQGDAATVLATLAPESVHCVVTSPPYWGLRDYGTPGQLGLEATPEEYVAALVDVFRSVRRVLRPDGTVWLNLGDSYGGGGTIGRKDTTPDALARRAERYGSGIGAGSAVGLQGTRAPAFGIKPKDLVGIPWRVAFALQADGWYLRSDIIWAKPNPMPESVTDRPTKSHEYLFLLSKSARYYFDADAVREPGQDWTNGGPGTGIKATTHYHPDNGGNEGLAGLAARYKTGEQTTGRNLRTVWTIATEPYPGAHFATFPRKLVEPCIKAGCPEGGTVLDPFAGTGTTGLVAQSLSRRAVLIDLNAEYLVQCLERNRQTPLGLVTA